MPELLETDVRSGGNAVGIEPPSPAGGTTALREDRDLLVRRELRRQIGRLEKELGGLFASAFPRRGIAWDVESAGGPRVLGTEELEQVRDRLVVRLQLARGEFEAIAYSEERYRELIEQMLAAPEDYKWLRVSRDDIGEHGCGHWHSRPKWGVLGMLMGWWRVRISSGCP
jgi:hypothetical protein